MLFKTNNNIHNEEIKKFVSVSVGLTFGKLKPFILNAEFRFIVRLLGDKLYKKLTDCYYSLPDNYDPKTDLSTYDESDFSNHDYTRDQIIKDGKNILPLFDLLQFCQGALINLSIHEGFDQLKVILSDTGIQAPDTATRLFKYEEDNLRKSYIDTGLNWIDRTIGFLIKNIDNEALVDFKESPCYADFKTAIVQTTEQFNEVFNIRGSRLVFLNMRTFMQETIDMDISQVFAPDILESLKTNRTVTPTPEPIKTQLLAYIAKAVIHLSIVKAVTEYGLQFGDPGAFFTSTEVSGNNNEKKSSATADRITTIQKQHSAAGAGWLSLAIQYAKANDILCSTDTGLTIRRSSNTFKKTFWA